MNGVFSSNRRGNCLWASSFVSTVHPKYITVIMTKTQIVLRFESSRESASEGTGKLGKASLIKLNKTVDVGAWIVQVSAFDAS
jgi:hypothetical protein